MQLSKFDFCSIFFYEFKLRHNAARTTGNFIELYVQKASVNASCSVGIKTFTPATPASSKVMISTHRQLITTILTCSWKSIHAQQLWQIKKSIKLDGCLTNWAKNKKTWFWVVLSLLLWNKNNSFLVTCDDKPWTAATFHDTSRSSI